MTPSIGMQVAELVEQMPNATIEELEKEIRNKWYYSHDEAVECLKENFEYYKKLANKK